MNTLPFAVGEPFPSSEALRLGHSSRLLAKGVEAGYLIKLRHGWYCRTPAAEESRAVAIRRSISVALADAAEDTVASHTSAALLHGLPLVGTAESPTIHLTGSRPNGGRTARGLLHHTSPAPPTAVDVEGLRATTVPRTVADLSRTCGFVPGVCAADAALRTGLMTPRDFADEVERHRGRTGVGTARAVADFADGLSESPGESLSRCLMSRWAEVPRPRLQHEFRDPQGGFIARTDFDWDGRLVGEFDGRSKYTGQGMEGEDPGLVAWREKRREDSIRALGIVVVRWVWADLRSPARLRRILRDGLDRAGLR
ncbi:hypothetical protein [Dietzia sp. B32]|uniref:hypothetical protein n=1 Tax=Dietzia sp. B32 TaxID=2915130 RepID=UPI0021ADDA72|nr:hypothetical protein [Dietzia sp. B32]UVE96254.1 hypothetical protein L8M95_05610 [Dietzia sp. B32]